MKNRCDLTLVKPTMDLKEQALSYRKEHFDYGDKVINGSELFDKIECYEEWLNKVSLNSNPETVDPTWVLTDTFFAVRETDQRIVGMIDLRYQLNDFLRDLGHCGYSVRPSERNKGYASEMLAQVCIFAKKYGLEQLHLSIKKSNVPSIKTVLKNGGVYLRSFTFEDEQVDIYSIGL